MVIDYSFRALPPAGEAWCQRAIPGGAEKRNSPPHGKAGMAVFQGFVIKNRIKRRDMKVTSSIKRRCESCQIIKRKGVVRVVCPRNPRHKQKQG